MNVASQSSSTCPIPFALTPELLIPQELHCNAAELAQGLHQIIASPPDRGILRMIVVRPDRGARQVLEEARVDLHEGMIGDNWRARGSRSSPDGTANRDMQLNIMNSRVIDLLTRGRSEFWPLAGDQLFVDLDISERALPPGTRLRLGETVVIEITTIPHTGCIKFSNRFGKEAIRWVNSDRGRELRLRGACAKVVVPGTVRKEDPIETLK